MVRVYRRVALRKGEIDLMDFLEDSWLRLEDHASLVRGHDRASLPRLLVARRENKDE